MGPRPALASLALLCSTLGLASCGCGPYAFAPIARSTHYGAPASLEPRHMSVGAGATAPYGTGGPSLAYAINELVQVEAGAELYLLGLDDVGWGLGYGGVRFTPFGGGGESVRFALDFEGGLGGGAGGALECDEESESFDPEDPPFAACANPEELRPWWRRWAFGGYAGLGLGVHVAWFSAFARVRAQIVEGADVPPSLWWSAVTGVAADIVGWADFYLSAGGAGVESEGFTGNTWIVDAGLAITFPLRR